MSYTKFSNTIDYVNRFMYENNISDCVFIKDIKLDTNEYFGSNVDVLCTSEKSYKSIYKYLSSEGFIREKISFEYDKTMFYPPHNNEELTQVHLYPYLGWYTIRVNFWKGNLLDHTEIKGSYRIPVPAFEIPLILFHAYYEDRILRDYDVRHINKLMSLNKTNTKEFKKVINDKYYPLFTYLFLDFENRKVAGSIEYKDFIHQMKFVFSTKNSMFKKMYYLSIHVAKKLRLIRG